MARSSTSPTCRPAPRPRPSAPRAARRRNRAWCPTVRCSSWVTTARTRRTAATWARSRSPRSSAVPSCACGPSPASMHSDAGGTPAAAPDPDTTPAAPAEPAPEVPRRSRSRRRNVVEWVVVVAGALAIAIVLQITTVQAFRIPSESMLPLLEKGDRVLVNKWSYRLHDVNRGDVVVFSRPPELTDPTVDDLIKRVIGVPGDSVSIADGKVSINGEVLDEPYLAEGSTTMNVGPVACTPEVPCVVPEGRVWVMGDNRNQSEDSRWFGPIKESSI